MRIIVGDTETANLKGGVVDFAGIEIDENFNVLHTFQSLIDPECQISFSSMGIHHITQEMVHTAPTMDEWIGIYGNPLNDDDLVICGHNIQFDYKVLGKWMPEKFRSICTLRLARDLYPEAEDHKLQTLRYMFDLEAGDAHRAMGDCVTALSLMKHIAKDRGTNALGLLEMMARPASLDTKLTFGKHKGMTMRDVPMSYVNWMLGQTDFDPYMLEAAALRKS